MRYKILQKERHLDIKDPLLRPFPKGDDWKFELKYMSPYKKLNLLINHRRNREYDQKLQSYLSSEKENTKLEKVLLANKQPSLWQVDLKHRREKKQKLRKYLTKEFPNYLKSKKTVKKDLQAYLNNRTTKNKITFQKTRRTIEKYKLARAEKNYLRKEWNWLEQENEKIRFIIMPLIRPFHWEDDAGGSQAMNHNLHYLDLTRINRKDLFSSLLFGIRISLVVGLLSVGLSLIIGLPIGSIAGYYGGKIDILVFRVLEVWESMPTLYMLLLIVAVLQTKSIFLTITVIGLFSWTGFCRFIRGETLKQKNLPYVDACRSMGFSNRYIIFYHILPNAIPPLLTLLPFSIMGAISSEAGLSFLGLGEEGSCSWGVLMDEGRTAFPGESYLLWPPAILLTVLLIAIALIGDALRDAFDPKMRDF